MTYYNNESYNLSKTREEAVLDRRNMVYSAIATIFLYTIAIGLGSCVKHNPINHNNSSTNHLEVIVK